jgi:hypothetical protein
VRRMEVILASDSALIALVPQETRLCPRRVIDDYLPEAGRWTDF